MPWLYRAWSREICPWCGRAAWMRYARHSYFGGKYGGGVVVSPHFTWASRWCIWGDRVLWGAEIYELRAARRRVLV